MHGIPNIPRSARCGLPALGLSAPPMIQLEGRGWVSTVGLAATMRIDHQALIGKLAKVEADKPFWDQHTRVFGSGGAILILLDRAAYGALLDELHDAPSRQFWQPLIDACFLALDQAPPPVPVPTPEALPARWWQALLSLPWTMNWRLTP